MRSNRQGNRSKEPPLFEANESHGKLQVPSDKRPYCSYKATKIRRYIDTETATETATGDKYE